MATGLVINICKSSSEGPGEGRHFGLWSRPPGRDLIARVQTRHAPDSAGAD